MTEQIDSVELDALDEAAEIVGHHRVVVSDGIYKCVNCGATATGTAAYEMFPCQRGTSR